MRHIWRILTSALLTLIALSLLGRWIDWAVIKAVFHPDLAACKALVHEGACWGVIPEKFGPLLLGHYPFEQRWRGWAMLLISAATALTLMRLVRGGTRVSGRWLLALGLVWFASAIALLGGGVAGLSAVPSTQWGGLPLTLLLAFCSLLLSLPLGVLLALGRRSQRRWVHIPCVSIIELVRGVPLVTLLFTGAFMLPAVFPSDWQPSLLVRASFALTLFSSAYLAEVVRSGLQTVPQEQIEAAQVLGLSSWAIQWQVVLPQAMRTVLPGLTGHTIGLLKDTSLVMVISLHELTGSLSLSLGGDADWRPYYLEGYLFIAALYALMCLGLGWTGRQLEARWAWGSTKA